MQYCVHRVVLCLKQESATVKLRHPRKYFVGKACCVEATLMSDNMATVDPLELSGLAHLNISVAGEAVLAVTSIA